jgi:hypothetical protein
MIYRQQHPLGPAKDPGQGMYLKRQLVMFLGSLNVGWKRENGSR